MVCPTADTFPCAPRPKGHEKMMGYGVCVAPPRAHLLRGTGEEPRRAQEEQGRVVVAGLGKLGTPGLRGDHVCGRVRHVVVDGAAVSEDDSRQVAPCRVLAESRRLQHDHACTPTLAPPPSLLLLYITRRTSEMPCRSTRIPPRKVGRTAGSASVHIE